MGKLIVSLKKLGLLSLKFLDLLVRFQQSRAHIVKFFLLELNYLLDSFDLLIEKLYLLFMREHYRRLALPG